MYDSVSVPISVVSPRGGGRVRGVATPTPAEKTLERLKHPDVSEPEPRDQRDQTRKRGVRIRRHQQHFCSHP